MKDAISIIEVRTRLSKTERRNFIALFIDKAMETKNFVNRDDAVARVSPVWNIRRIDEGIEKRVVKFYNTIRKIKI